MGRCSVDRQIIIILKMLHSFDIGLKIKVKRRLLCSTMRKLLIKAWNKTHNVKEAAECFGVNISYIQTGQSVLYLSMIRDLYENSIVAYKTAALLFL